LWAAFACREATKREVAETRSVRGFSLFESGILEESCGWKLLSRVLCERW
jgi:hypothetical protein